MAQTFVPPTGSTVASTAIKTNLVACDEALRTLFSGATAPSGPSTYQLWADTTTMTIKQWDGASWVVLIPLLATQRIVLSIPLGTLTGTGAITVGSAPSNMVVERAVLLTGSTTTSDGSNYWEFQIRNATQAVDLLAADQSTDGADVTANTAYVIAADQNETIDEHDVIEFEWTETGTATAMADAVVQIQGYARGA